MIRRRGSLCRKLAAALLLMPFGARTDGLAAPAIDEIQVTATRRAVAASEVAAAVTLIPQSDIRDRKLITDALQSRPGVFLQQTTPGQGAAIVRGLKGSELLHLVDGFRLNNAIFRNAPTPFLALVPVASADRVEVLRGAPASMYGSDAAGGVVQVLSRFPDFESASADLRRDLYLGMDSAEKGRMLRGTFEYGTSRLAGLVSAEYLRTGDRRVGGGERIGPTGYESHALRFALSANPDADRQWLVDVQFARQPDTPRIDELVSGFGQTDASSSEFSFQPNERVFTHVRFNETNGWGAADWTVDAGWQRIVDDPLTRDFGSTVRNRESNSSDLTGITVSAARTLDRISWIAGAEFYHDLVRSKRVEEDTDTGTVRGVQSRYPDRSRVRQAAVYFNASIAASVRHTVTGGLRYSSVDVHLPASGMVPEGGVLLDDLSADASWRFDIAESWQIVANVGRGFRAPNVFDLGTLGERPGNRFNIPSPGLGAEHVTQFDAGLRFLRSGLTAELVVYRLRYADRITSVLTGDVTSDGRDVIQSRNVSSAWIRGIEAFATAEISSRLSAGLLLNYGYGKQSEEDGSSVPADRMPPLNGQLKFEVRLNEQWSLDTSLQFADKQSRLSPRDVRDIRINPAGTSGWGIVNTRADWQPGNGWHLAAELVNLLDHRYRNHGSGIDATGRSLLLSASRRW